MSDTIFDFPIAPEENPLESGEVKTPAEEKFEHLTQCMIRIALDLDKLGKAVEQIALNYEEAGRVFGEYAKLIEEKEKEMKNGNQESEE